MNLGKASLHLELTDSPRTISDLNQDNLVKNHPNSFYEEQLELLAYLPKFLIWLNNRIKSGNHQFITKRSKRSRNLLSERPT